MTKARQKHYAFIWSSIKQNKSLYDAYKKPSVVKQYAWELIKRDCNRRNGTDLTVLTHNTTHFTAAYKWISKDGYPMLTVITKTEMVDIDIQAINDYKI